jgi:hypothetical protein
MEDAIQTYLADLEELSLEVDAILYTSKDELISNQVKIGLKDNFLAVMERMKPLHEYSNAFPEYHLWGECNQAYDRLVLKVEALLKHNKHVKL